MLALVALVGGLISYLTFAEFLFEDSYITLRYATQLASGNGLVFQTGEWVLGTSAPLWAMVMALPIALGVDPELVMDAAFCASIALLGYSGGRLLQRLGAPRAGVVFAVLVALGVGRVQAFWGMETPLFTALLMGAWCLALDRRFLVSGLVLGLACVTRYEGYAFAVALAAVTAATGRWPAFRSGGLGVAAVTLPWLGIAWRVYGDVLPLPTTTKAAHVSSARYFERAYLDLPYDLFWTADGRATPYTVGLVVAGLIAVFGCVGLWRLARTRAALMGALPLGAVIVFAVLVHRAPGPLCTWHRVPLFMVALVVALYGAAQVVGDRWRGGRLGWAGVALALAAAIPVHAGASARLRNTFQYVGREIAYPEIADFLRRTGLNELTVLTWEPGYLAFMSDVRVIDVAGLVTPPPEFTKVNTPRWDHGFPGEADLVLLRAPFRPEGFELIFEGSMGAWLLARPHVVRRFAGAIEAYRAGEAAGGVGLEDRVVRLVPSYDGPPFVAGEEEGWRALGAEQEMLAVTAETEVLLLDRDELVVEFRTSTPEFTQLQLVVRGEVVKSTGERAASVDGEVRWDVRKWRGRTARVRVLALAGNGAVAEFGGVWGG